MRDLLLATHNRHKVSELRQLIADDATLRAHFRVISFDDIDFHDDIIEDGQTFAENATIKAKVGVSMGYITIADDSGLAVDALDGAPGVYSARFSGEGATDASNNALLLEKLEGVPYEARTGRYVCVIVCMFPEGQTISCRGTCEGHLLNAPLGEGGFGYDPLFLEANTGKTFAQLTAEEKNQHSHRGKAMRALAEQLIAALASQGEEE